MSSKPRPRVIIVGGSLCGLTLALACAKRGIGSLILEQRRCPQFKGTALGVDRALLMRVVCSSERLDETGSEFPVTTPFRNAVSWSALHRWLRDRAHERNEIRIREGISVTRVAQNGEIATALSADGQRFDAEIIVGADGYKSVVRQSIDPARAFGRYAGYMLWRGLVDEDELPLDALFPKGSAGIGLVGFGGHRLVAFPVAGEDGSLEPGRRRICFTWYDLTQNAMLEAKGCLSPTRQVIGGLAGKEVPHATVVEVCALAQNIWPDPWRAFILHAFARREIFATPVAEFFPELICVGRLALAGDAAHTVSPMTGRGFVAGIQDAEALANCLGHAAKANGNDISLALGEYRQARLASAQNLVRDSAAVSRSFVLQAERSNKLRLIL